MVNPIITWHEQDDNTLYDDIQNPIDFGVVDPGVTGTPLEIHLWNNKGGVMDVSDMTDIRLTTVTKNGYLAGDSGPAGYEGAYGRFLVEDNYIQVKSVTDEDAQYIPIGGAVTKSINDIRGSKLATPNVVTGNPGQDPDASMVAGTYFYKVSAFDEAGETLAGVESQPIVLASPNNQIILEWEEVEGALGYKIFRTTSSGIYGSSSQIATVLNVLTFTDVALNPSTGSPLTTATTTYGHKEELLFQPVIPTNADAGPVEFNIRALFKFI